MQLTISPSRTILFATSTVNTSGDNTIIAAVANKKICIIELIVQNESTSATTVILKSGGQLKRFLLLLQGDALILKYAPEFEMKLGVNSPLVLNLSGNNLLNYSIEYYLE